MVSADVDELGGVAIGLGNTNNLTTILGSDTLDINVAGTSATLLGRIRTEMVKADETKKKLALTVPQDRYTLP